MRVPLDKCCRSQDLAGLTITALWNFLLNPRPLNRMIPIAGESFDSCDLLANGRFNAGATRFHRIAIDEDSATPAVSLAATELRSRKPQRIAQNPKKRCAGLHINGARFAINCKIQTCHGGSPHYFEIVRIREVLPRLSQFVQPSN